jgi:hypothetical protein
MQKFSKKFPCHSRDLSTEALAKAEGGNPWIPLRQLAESAG